MENKKEEKQNTYKLMHQLKENPGILFTFLTAFISCCYAIIVFLANYYETQYLEFWGIGNHVVIPNTVNSIYSSLGFFIYLLCITALLCSSLFHFSRIYYNKSISKIFSKSSSDHKTFYIISVIVLLCIAFLTLSAAFTRAPGVSVHVVSSSFFFVFDFFTLFFVCVGFFFCIIICWIIAYRLSEYRIIHKELKNETILENTSTESPSDDETLGQKKEQIEQSVKEMGGSPTEAKDALQEKYAYLEAQYTERTSMKYLMSDKMLAKASLIVAMLAIVSFIFIFIYNTNKLGGRHSGYAYVTYIEAIESNNALIKENDPKENNDSRELYVLIYATDGYLYLQKATEIECSDETGNENAATLNGLLTDPSQLVIISDSNVQLQLKHYSYFEPNYNKIK